MNNKQLIYILIVVVIVGVGLLAYYRWQPAATEYNAVSENNVTVNIPLNEEIKQNPNITLKSPKTNDTLGQNFNVSGEARGSWYFEASFPIVLLDADRNELTTVIATAEGEWMTEDFVPFSATVDLKTKYLGKAFLVLKKDNPSGESKYDDQIEIPITISD